MWASAGIVRLGPPPPPARVGLGAGSVYVADASSAVSAAGIDPASVLPPGMTWAQIDSASRSAIGGLSSGQFTFTSLAPIIGIALAATGVGAPVGALVTVVLVALDQIRSWFSPPAPSCSWRVGGVCFQGKQPYGPGDPSWQTFEQFEWNPQIPWAFPWWYTIARDNLSAAAAVGVPQAPPPLGIGTANQTIAIPGGADAPAVAAFIQAFTMAWLRNAEVAINGFAPADPYAIALTTSAAWNATHAAGNTFTFQPVSGGSAFPYFDGTNYIASPVLFLQALLAGDVDQKDRPPFTINTGPDGGGGGALAPGWAAVAQSSVPSGVQGAMSLLQSMGGGWRPISTSPAAMQVAPVPGATGPITSAGVPPGYALDGAGTWYVFSGSSTATTTPATSTAATVALVGGGLIAAAAGAAALTAYSTRRTFGQVLHGWWTALKGGR